MKKKILVLFLLLAGSVIMPIPGNAATGETTPSTTTNDAVQITVRLGTQRRRRVNRRAVRRNNRRVIRRSNQRVVWRYVYRNGRRVRVRAY